MTRNAGPGTPWSPDEPLRGRPLRRVALAVLLRTPRPCTVTEVVEAIGRYGFAIGSEHPAKAVADAMAYEVERGWLRRVERGRYAVGLISRGTRYRILTQFP